MKPPYLKSGDEVAIVATAKQLKEGQIDGAIREIESWGLRVRRGQSLNLTHHYFAGSDHARAQDLQIALDDDSIRAVIFARGGYGTVRIIDQIDWSGFKASPKWLCGFSDLTVLHAHVNRALNIETMHSSMPIFFADGQKNIGSESLRAALFGQHQGTTWAAHPLNREGNCEGQLIGGNLAVLISVLGSSSEPDFSGKILFLEDLTEQLYHLDRMMMQLKRAGILENLKGLIVGQFTDMEDGEVSFGYEANEIIHQAISSFDYPVAFNAPVGHVEHNQVMFSGRQVNLNIDASNSSLLF